MNMESSSWRNENWQGNRRTRRKPRFIYSTTNGTWSDLESNARCSCESPVANYLRDGMALAVPIWIEQSALKRQSHKKISSVIISTSDSWRNAIEVMLFKIAIASPRKSASVCLYYAYKITSSGRTGPGVDSASNVHEDQKSLKK
jgi:hypothetical protein